MVLTSQSHLAITDVLCIPYRTGFSKILIPVPIQIILAIPDELAVGKKKVLPPPHPACKSEALKLKMDEDVYGVEMRTSRRTDTM